MIRYYWKGQNVCVPELSIEQEGFCLPFCDGFPVMELGDGDQERMMPREPFSREAEMNFELADGGEKGHEWTA